ncbi:MAG: alanine--tRNA ligase-related protein [Bacillota bacterium]|nr:alanine--tRNA ligase-related protein [Bacillota bacterium]
MTEKLYYDDVYIKESLSRVVEAFEKDGKLLVVLDKTPFYPEGGGQPSDTGRIGDAHVSYVFEEDDTIYHVVDKLPENTLVLCNIDFERRYDFMQQHSGEHMLAATFYKLYGAVSQGFHMGDDYVSIDMSFTEISTEEVKRIESVVNGHIYSNVPVNTFVVTPEESRSLTLRKRVEGEDQVRIVQIGEVDACACCGTHVKYTGEVGIIKIIKTEKYKGMTRIYFKCGRRAFEDYILKHDIVSTLVRNLSTGEGELVDKATNDMAEVKALGRKLGEYKRRLSGYEAQNLKARAENRVVSFIYEDKEMDEVQMIAEDLASEDLFIILGSALSRGIIVFSGGGHNVNVGQFFKENMKAFSGKGGGSAKRAQGSFGYAEDMKAFAAELLKQVNK